LQADNRLLEPRIRVDNKLSSASWKTALENVASQLKQFVGWQIAILASGRMTNEELWLTSLLAGMLGITLIDIVPRSGPSDDILLSEDRNPNTNGARLMRLASPSAAVLSQIKDAIGSGHVQALITLGENPLKCGITLDQLASLPVFIVMDLLANDATNYASAILPSLSFAEKRGSMINGKGRLQRLNPAIAGPGQARDDWEILRDLIQAISGTNGIYSIEDVFRQMSAAVPEFAGLSLSKIDDLGVQLIDVEDAPGPPGEPATEKIKERQMEKHPQ
jgi:NADH-quinone oxidoreductase subunit G